MGQNGFCISQSLLAFTQVIINPRPREERLLSATTLISNVKVLLTPGSYYEPWQGEDKRTTSARGGEKGVGNFRLAYSMTTVSSHCLDQDCRRETNALYRRKRWS